MKNIQKKIAKRARKKSEENRKKEQGRSAGSACEKYSEENSKQSKKKNAVTDGDAGYRSPYLSHAKRALYHLSYIPIMVIVIFFYNL